MWQTQLLEMERWFPNRRSDPAGVNYPGEPVSEPIDRRNAAPGSTLPGSGGREQPAGGSPSLPLEERAGERRLVTIFDAAGRGDIPAGWRAAGGGRGLSLRVVGGGGGGGGAGS